MADLERRLGELGIELPAALPVRGRYRSVVVRGDLAYTSGALAVAGPPWRVDHAGVVGRDLTVDEAKASARGALVTTLANLAGALGGLDRVDSFVHLRGYVRTTDDVDKVHHVVGGATDLLAELFGDDRLPPGPRRGYARSPTGRACSSMPWWPFDRERAAREHRPRLPLRSVPTVWPLRRIGILFWSPVGSRSVLPIANTGGERRAR